MQIHMPTEESNEELTEEERGSKGELSDYMLRVQFIEGPKYN